MEKRHLEKQPRIVSHIVTQLSAEGFANAAEIGRGGFGAVYRCTQIELDRVVAVKVLTLDLEENRQRFEREQRAMAKLTGHPNIVPVLQVGETYDGHPYLVMPYCRRGCIQSEIDRLGELPLADVLRLGVKIAAALESAHRLGIVHRDVKPANVLVTDYGEPALTDFGIAHMTDTYKTSSGILTGSPAFTAPEVLRGDSAEPASDVYSMGATLFSGLTGHPPFEGLAGESVFAYLLRITTEPMPDLREHGVAEDVAAVIHSALSTDPADRPSALEFGKLLQALQARHGHEVDGMALEGCRLQGAAGPGATPSTSHPSLSASRSLRSRLPRGRFPAPLAGFVGREAERAELAELIKASRLVTLAGVGGVGKTTLALQVARDQVAHFDDGVWLVELGEVSDGSLVTGVAAGALGIRDQGARPLADAMVDALAERTALVVFDNCEHVIDDAARLVETLLHGCSRLQILATSREVLGIGGEAVLPISPLSYPDLGSPPNRSNLAEYDAVALFVERARTAHPGFALTQRNAAAVGRICACLDGLPLAIELAAARLRAMSVDQVADRLSDRFALLTRGRRGAPTRQQTLHWCIAWSFDRCTVQEQQLWARLSVFAGSFELDAAQDICAADKAAGDLLDDLCALVDKSILIRNEDEGVVRFRLLATIREYGRAHIGSAEEYLQLQRRHVDWYRRLVSTAKTEFFSESQVRWINRLRREMANLQEALQFAVSDDPVAALEMSATMRLVWIAIGMLAQGRRWVEQALRAAAGEPTVHTINAFAALGVFALFQADWPTARSCVAQARELLTVAPDARAHGLIETLDGFGALLRGELDQAQANGELALATSDDFEVQIFSMLLLSWRFSITGDAVRALSYGERALALAESRHEAVMRNYMLTTVAAGRFALGDLDLAQRAMLDGLQRSRLIGHPWIGAQFIEMLAWVAAASRHPRRAAVLMAAAAAVSRASGTSSTTMTLLGLFHDECQRRTREQLSVNDFEAASAEGNMMTFDEAAAFALAATH